MADVVNHQPLTVEAQVQFHTSSCGICSGQNCTGTGFLHILQFYPVSIIHELFLIHSSVTDNIISAIDSGIK
jgi:hypothetical protein